VTQSRAIPRDRPVANWTSLQISTTTGPGRPPDGQGEGLPQHPLQVAHILDQIVVLGDGPGHADGVHLLKGVRADGEAGHLAGDEEGGDGILVGVGDGGDQVGGTGTRGGQGHPHPAAGPGIALRGVSRPPFLAAEDELR
jgi:hypothetical protein